MKQGWEIKKLGQVCDIINGRNQKMVECVDGAYPIYGSGGIMGYASQFLCKAGTTIIGRKGTINKPIYVEEPFWNVDTAFGFQPKSTLNSKLLYYFCLHFDFLKLNKGTTIPSLVKADLLQIDMPYTPSIAEQQRIVEILDREFEKIDALKASAERSLQQAKDLFQSALKQELQCDKYHNLNEIYNIKTGKLNSNAAEDGGIYPFFTCSREIFAINTYAFDCEAILLAGNNASGDFNVKYYNGKFNAYQRTYIITAKKAGTNVRMLYYILTNYLTTLKKMYLGANTKFLKLGMIENILIPNFDETHTSLVVGRLDNLSKNCKKLEENYTKTMALCDDMKQALLRQAFNGEL